MSLPSDSSQPSLAPGCRWGEHGAERVVLFPEGMIRLQGTALCVLELCDGQRTVQEIVAVLSEQYTSAERSKIQQDVAGFLETLQQKRIVNY